MQHFFTKTKIISSLFALVTLFFIAPHAAHAGFLDAITGTGDFVLRIVSTSMELLLMPAAAFMLYLAGAIMDSAINFSLHTAYIFSLSPAINLGWSIIRDIANIFFIFALIYISLGTIIQGTAGFNTKKLLKDVIIAALLINFSLFFTKVIVDVSNIFGNWLYGGVQRTLENNSSDPKNPASLSNLISIRMDVLGVESDVKKNDANKGANIFTGASNSLIGRFLRIAVILIAAYMFAYTAILFLARSVTILFLLIFSPIGFMGGVLPQLKDYSKKWWGELSTAAVFPIIFLLMLYIALQFINSFGSLGLKSVGTVRIFDSNYNVGDYFQYFIIIFLLKSCLDVAKKNSGAIGDLVGGFAQTLGKLAVNTAIGMGSGGAAILGRSAAAGLFSRYVDKKSAGDSWKTFGNTIRTNSPLLTKLTTGPNLFKNPVEAVAKYRDDVFRKGTYDARNFKIGGGILGPSLGEIAKGATGFDVNKASVAGFNTEALSRKEIKENKKEWEEEIRIDTQQKIIMEQIRDLLAAQKTGNPAAIAAAKAAIHARGGDGEIKKALNNLSNKELEKLNPKINTNDYVVGLMTGNQVKHLKDNSDLTNSDKDKVWNARIKPLTTAYNLPAGGVSPTGVPRADEIKEALNLLSDVEVSELNPDVLKDRDVIPHLTPGQLGKIAQNLSRADRQQIRELIEGTAVAGVIGNPKAVTWLASPQGAGAQF